MLDALDAPRVERSQARRREVGYTFAGLALLSLGLVLNLDRIQFESLEVDAPVAARLAVIYAGAPEVERPDAPPPPPPSAGGLPGAAGPPVLAGSPNSTLAEDFAEGMQWGVESSLVGTGTFTTTPRMRGSSGRARR